MDKIINKLPLPISGLMLGLAALGNLIGPYSLLLKNTLGLISVIIAVLIIIKVVKVPKSLKEGFSNPVVASVMPTFSMGLMLLSTYLKPMVYPLAFSLWIIGLALHVIFIIMFTKKYILNFDIKKVFPSYFIVYVGIISASVTSPAYQMQTVGQLIFWFGLISYVTLLPVVVYRIVKLNALPTPAMPTLIIFAAPASLCLAGYLNAFSVKNSIMIYSLAAIALLMNLYAILQMPKLLKLPFMPSYSAFTFPFVISAISAKGFLKFITATGSVNATLSVIANILILLSSIMVIYVLFRYTLFIFKAPVTTTTKSKKIA